MHTIPKALLWEIFARGRWAVIGFFLLGNLMPMLVYTAMSRFAVDTADPAFLNMHILFLPLIMFEFAIGMFVAQGSLARLYTVPVSTRALVTWHMIPGSLLLASEMAIALWAQNLLFDFDYPVLGPSLFAATAWAAAQLFVCVSQRTISGFLVTAAPSVALLFWLHSRYGGWFSQPSHFWHEVSVIDLITLISVFAVSHVCTVAAVGRDRCGEKMPSLNGWKWFIDFLERRGRAAALQRSPFKSPESAQAWSEWKSKGIAFPLVIILVLLFGVALALVRTMLVGDANENFQLLHEGLVAGGGILSLIAAVSGLLVGSTARFSTSRNRNMTIRDFAGQAELERMGHFPATRPMTDGAYANVILRTAFKSSLISWTLWGLALASTFAVRNQWHGPVANAIPDAIGRWYFPLTFLGAWIAIANMSTVMLTGRGSKILFSGTMVAISCTLVSSLLSGVLPKPLQQMIGQGLSWSVSTTLVIATALAVIKATQQQLIARPAAFRILAAWLAIIALALATKPSSVSILAIAFIAAFSALVVLPFAAAPLAVSWNRHR